MTNLEPITRKEAILNGDDITPVTREEYFAKKAVSGGGSFPAPTSEDIGKVMTAIGGSKTATLVPEQTLTNVAANTPVALSNSTFEGIDVGDTVHVTITASSISHDSFDEDVEVTSQGIVLMGKADVYTIYDSGTGIYFSSDYSLTGVTIEVTAEVAGKPMASWQTASGGGGIPSPTAEDVGKVLTVAAKVNTIVPEQSVVLTTSADQKSATSPLTGVDFSTLSDGDSVKLIATLNGSDPAESIGSFNASTNQVTANGAVLGFEYTTTVTASDVTFSSDNSNVIAAIVANTQSVSATAVSATEATASWQFSPLIVKASGECTYTPGDSSNPSYWSVGIDTSVQDIGKAFYAGTPVLFQFPEFTTSAPYYSTDTVNAQILLPFLDSYSVSSHNEHFSYGLERGGNFFSPTITMWYSVEPSI